MIEAPADVAAPPADAQRSESGLAWKVLEGLDSGNNPGPRDNVTVHYTGWTTDGQMFDSSILRGEPANFPLNGVIAGWTEGLQYITTGQKARFWIPMDLAYQGRPGRPHGMLVFDVELIEMQAAPEPPATPEDVAAAPASANKTTSGLAYRVLQVGSGGARPSASSTVTVHYSGWTTDGELFDSSILRGETISFPLNRVIPGWTEALQLMVAGEKSRFWIPEELAYKGVAGAPQGVLVFDVELISFR